MSILEKYASRNYYDRHLDDFATKLEAGQVNTHMLLPWDTYGSECVLCGEKVLAFKYRGERYDLHESGRKVIVHQCPDPNGIGAGGGWPDDPEVRDGDGEIRGGGWTDPGPEPDRFPDDPYMYPDIPYVDPTR